MTTLRAAEPPAPSSPEIALGAEAQSSVFIEQEAPEQEQGAEPVQPVAEASPTAPTPSPTPPPAPPLASSPVQRDPELTRLTEQMREYQRGMAELQDRYATQQDAADLREYRDRLSQLYPGMDTSGLVRERQQHLAMQRRLAAQDRQLRQAAEQQVVEINSKARVATILHQRYGMPIQELMEFDNPQLMHAEARAWQSSQELARLKQSQTPAPRPPNAAPSRSRLAVNADNIDKLYNEGRISSDVYDRFLKTGEIRS